MHDFKDVRVSRTLAVNVLAVGAGLVFQFWG